MTDEMAKRGGSTTEALVAAGDHVDRLLSASSPEQVLELAAELTLAVSRAGGVQVFAEQSEGLVEIWAGGQLQGDEAGRRTVAAKAIDTKRAEFGEGVLAIPVVADRVKAAVVAEAGEALDEPLAALLGVLASRGLAAAALRDEAETQRKLRLSLSRYVCPSIAVTIARGDHDELTKPEQRPVSILVLVVDGLATEVDLIGPQRVLPVVNQYYSTIADAVYEREGVLLEVGLERVIAVFGAPIRADDATGADLAAACGFRLLEGLKEMADSFGVEGLPVHLEARVGVSTGPATVGSFGSAERPVFGALGAQVTLARELAGQGAPGEMVVDSATRSLLAERLSTRSIGAVEVQGLDYPVFAYGAERNQ